MAVPDRPHLQRMRRPAGDDKGAKHEKQPRVGHVAPPPHEKHQRQRDREIRQRDQSVGDAVQPQQTRRPKVALPMGHEVSATEFDKPLLHGSLISRRHLLAKQFQQPPH